MDAEADAPRLAQPYERLLQDVIEGDPTHFARQDYVEEAWRVVQPVLDSPEPVIRYGRGTWGPSSDEDPEWIPCGPGQH